MNTIAIIGSRRMSLYGKRVISWLMDQLVEKEVMVVTGQTLGVNREVARMAEYKKINFKIITAKNGMEKMNLELAKMADKLVVIEGGKNSGTILVAKNFLDLGKEVWAVPGNIFEENSYTPNWLIENGANILNLDENKLTI